MRILEQFVKDCVEECPGVDIDKEEFYGALIHYCRDKNLYPVAKDFVGKNLQMVLPDVRSSYCKVGSAIKRCWQNIKIKKE